MSEAENLKQKLFKQKKCGWDKATQEEKDNIFSFSEKYLNYINNGKTEREIIAESIKIAEQNGFKNIEEKETLNPGDKVYFVNREKAIYLAVIGENKLEDGINIIGAHADSPRLDLKPSPLYEDNGLAYLKTHYYGGIKKYQWTTIPLAIHGVIAKPNGEKITVRIGEEETDPIFTITDLLPHLAREQMEKKLNKGIEGESLNLLIGSIPYGDENEKVSERVKLNILNLLNMKYGITEVDFLSSELEIVPAFRARTMGFDQSLVAAYGQDDKVCCFASLSAIMEINNPKTTAVCMLVDKEEIGSMGNTGMHSHVFDAFISELLNKKGENKPNALDKLFTKSKMLSADVDAGFDPMYANVSEKNNASYLGHGVCMNKYTGVAGKAGASDANAEYIANIRRILEENNISYQISELGKIDLGGGGTIAYILANKGIDVIDCGVPVLSMHAPYEVTSKYDIYSAYRTYKAFFEN